MSMKTFAEAEQWLHSLRPFGMKPGLERVQMMLDNLGNPERRMTSIHIGGTNGKGSTTTVMRSILQAAGVSAGTFTSPYVEHFRERISVDGEPISEEDFLDVANTVRPIAESIAKLPSGPPTEFEVLTVIAAYYFASKAFPRVVLWEVGLGGMYDSTNVVHPAVSIITNVGHDHQHILGETIEEIAEQKAGIIKPGVPVITCEQKPEAVRILKETANARNSRFHQEGEQFSAVDVKQTEKGYDFSFRSILLNWEDLSLHMKGRYQVHNASAALLALSYLKMYYAFPIEKESILEGLAGAYWPGRMEVIAEKPLTILDGAHNEEAFAELAASLAERYPERSIRLLVAMTEEKDPTRLLAPFQKLPVTSVIATTYDFPRAASAETVVENSPLEGTVAESNWQDAYQQMKENAEAEDIICITGSLYFISEIKQSLNRTNG